MAASGRRGGVAYARRRPGPSLRRGRRAARSQLGRGGRAAQRSGPNKLAAGKAEPRWHAFARQYRDPMQIELLAAGIGSIYPLKQLGTGILLILLNTPLGDRADMVYMNTNVTRGAGEFVVTATGMATEVGHISGMLAEEPDLKTPLARQMDRLSGQILVVAGIALVVSMALNLARGQTFIAVFNAAVAFAIAAIPVGLPTVVTTILAWGTQQLAKAGAIMKRLASTETLGSTSAINSDKTGTLTLDQMTVVQMVAAGRAMRSTGRATRPPAGSPGSAGRRTSRWMSSWCRWCWPPT